MTVARPLIRVLEEAPGHAGYPGYPGLTRDRGGSTARVDILHTGSLTAAALWTVHSMEEETIVSFAPTFPHDRELGARFIAASDVITLSDAAAVWLFPGAAVDEVIDRLLRSGPALVSVQGTAGWTLGTRRASVTRPAACRPVEFAAALLHGLADLWADGFDATGLRRGLTTPLLARIGPARTQSASVPNSAPAPRHNSCIF